MFGLKVDLKILGVLTLKLSFPFRFLTLKVTFSLRYFTSKMDIFFQIFNSKTDILLQVKTVVFPQIFLPLKLTFSFRLKVSFSLRFVPWKLAFSLRFLPWKLTFSLRFWTRNRKFSPQNFDLKTDIFPHILTWKWTFSLRFLTLKLIFPQTFTSKNWYFRFGPLDLSLYFPVEPGTFLCCFSVFSTQFFLVFPLFQGRISPCGWCPSVFARARTPAVPKCRFWWTNPSSPWCWRTPNQSSGSRWSLKISFFISFSSSLFYFSFPWNFGFPLEKLLFFPVLLWSFGSYSSSFFSIFLPCQLEFFGT